MNYCSKTADAVSIAGQATAQTIEAACSCAAQQSGDDNIHVVTRACEDSSEDDRGHSKTKRDNSCYTKFRDNMKELVESTRFTRVILVSIFLNTMCMAVEHHGQVFKTVNVIGVS